MVDVRDPVFTTVLGDVTQLRPRPGSLYITGKSVEERSDHTMAWEAKCEQVEFARLSGADRSEATFKVAEQDRGVALRSATSVASFLEGERYSAYYLDITGLPHHVWAPVLKSVLLRPEPVFGVYVEPGDYRLSETPTEASIFDLSEKIEGIAPLPGFATLPRAAEGDPVFVPLLGFEGPRFAFVLESVQPKREDVVPIVGVPGYRPEYPFYTYVGNRIKLLETRSWQNVRFAPANCPFSLYYVLEDLFGTFAGRRMVVAAIGTKPHALGAVLYHLHHPSTTELVYDHPVRKPERTRGTSRVCVYELTQLQGGWNMGQSVG